MIVISVCVKSWLVLHWHRSRGKQSYSVLDIKHWAQRQWIKQNNQKGSAQSVSVWVTLWNVEQPTPCDRSFGRKYVRRLSGRTWVLSLLSRQSGLPWEEKVDCFEDGGWQISELSDPSSERFILLSGYSGMMLSLADEAKSCMKKG